MEFSLRNFIQGTEPIDLSPSFPAPFEIILGTFNLRDLRWKVQNISSGQHIWNMFWVRWHVVYYVS